MMMSVEKDPLRALPWYQCFTRVRVGPASCATLMNCYSSMNLVSKTMVDALNLLLIEHPEPYELWWKDRFVNIMHRIEVRFTLCGYGDRVMCDVLPVHMHTCSILLGKPWTDKRQLPYHSLGEFSFVHGGQYVSLESYTSENYMADRRKRDIAQAASEVNTKKVEAAEIFMDIVPSVNKSTTEENEPKPRTVLLQGGEDDMVITNRYANYCIGRDLVGMKERKKKGRGACKFWKRLARRKSA